MNDDASSRASRSYLRMTSLEVIRKYDPEIRVGGNLPIALLDYRAMKRVPRHSSLLIALGRRMAADVNGACFLFNFVG